MRNRIFHYSCSSPSPKCKLPTVQLPADDLAFTSTSPCASLLWFSVFFISGWCLTLKGELVPLLTIHPPTPTCIRAQALLASLCCHAAEMALVTLAWDAVFNWFAPLWLFFIKFRFPLSLVRFLYGHASNLAFFRVFRRASQQRMSPGDGITVFRSQS